MASESTSQENQTLTPLSIILLVRPSVGYHHSLARVKKTQHLMLFCMLVLCYITGYRESLEGFTCSSLNSSILHCGGLGPVGEARVTTLWKEEH